MSLDRRTLTTVAGGLGLLAFVGLIVMAFGWGGPSADDLLALESPTPEQIEQITYLIIAQDLDMRGRANERLIEIGEPAIEPLKRMADNCANHFFSLSPSSRSCLKHVIY